MASDAPPGERASVQAPARVVSLTPSNTEILAFLGLSDRLVGVDDWSDWPPAVAGVERVGPDLHIDLDQVVALEPELVLASRSVPGMEEVVEGVRQRGLPHLVLSPKSLAGVREDVREVAAAMGAAGRGRRLARAMADEVDRLASTTHALAPTRVYWEWWPKPAITPGSGGWMTEVMSLAGAGNVFGHRGEESLKVTAAQVAEAAPEVVALCWQGALHPVQSADRVQAREGWQEVQAVAEGRILGMPEALFGRPGPRLLEGIRHLAAALHPEVRDELGAPYAWVPEEVAADLGDALPPQPPGT